MFLTCKQVSNRLSKEDYAKLSPFRKFTLVLHVLICPICGRYNRMVMKFQDMARIYRTKEEEILESTDPDAPRLADDTRSRLQEQLNAAAGKEQGNGEHMEPPIS